MVLGLDTSNYTTSAALWDGTDIQQAKKLLTVKEGERGLRQSDAVFQHTVNLPALLESLPVLDLKAVGVSTRPRNVKGSYMPCFLVGETVARSVAHACGVPVYTTSHQVGHLLAALYDCGKTELLQRQFLAFHLSGGTTEALLVKPEKEEVLKAEVVAASLDLKAGQAIDRAGVMLGMTFPCGKELDRLSAQSDRSFFVRPSMKGADCSLSGIENKAKAMLQRSEPQEDIARFVLLSVTAAVDAMLEQLLQTYGEMPVLFSGGVSSNSLLRKTIQEKYDASFASPAFSLDNAAGTALFASIKHEGLWQS